MTENLENKIKTNKARIAVIGLGYVGLPLALSFAKKGFKVLGLDNDYDRVKRLNEGTSYILDIPSKELKNMVRCESLKASTDFALIKDMDVIIVCVPTPIKRRYTPDISFMLSAVKSVAQYLKKNTLVVLESTTYPGTTEELIRPILEEKGFKAEKDFFLAFSPERIDPGNKHYDVTRIPKIVGGLSEKSGYLTKMLYQKIIKKVHLVSSAKVAEMTKLLENSFRIVNIGWINEIAMMCHKMRIDIWEVIEAAKTKPFGFMPFYPGLGVGGHCIPEDPLYLYWKAKRYGFNPKFIKLAADTNAHMSLYAVHRLEEMLTAQKKKISSSKILILGVTYKKDVKDLRKSPSLKLIEHLQLKGTRVDYHDPIIPYLKIGHLDLTSVRLNPRTISHYDVIVVAVDHTAVNYQLVLKSAKMIFDTRNVYGKIKSQKVIKL
ncbi:MAG TPA: nucleotide sugar dehydrogenase [Candidatus Omnitrophota bacterium]|nr:nucleotide sugar dehydrogenase [Candidatus Omnitrophota bacterium]HPN88255.1 nucleotide sugar dehydrogenase [Candidatus Omnitrophota bacterium]